MSALLTAHLWQALAAGPLLLGAAAVPVWRWSRAWGSLPSAALIVLGILMLVLHAEYVI